MELVKLTVPAKQGRTRLCSGHLDLIDLHVCIYIYGSCDQQTETTSSIHAAYRTFDLYQTCNRLKLFCIIILTFCSEVTG